MLPLPAAGAGATGDTTMSSIQLIEQCVTRLRGIIEALDNIHDTSPHRWSTDLDDVHSSAESLLALIKDQAPAPCIDCKGTGFCNSISGEEIRCPCRAPIQFADPAQSPVEQLEQAPPSEDQLTAAGLSYPLAKEDAVKLWYSGFRSEVITVLEAWEAIGHDIGMNPDKGELLDSLRYMLEKCEAHDAALAEVAGLRSLLNSLLCYVERDIDRMRSDRDKSDNKEIYDRSISLAMERLKAAQNAVFTTEPGCDTAVELAAQTTQAQHCVPELLVRAEDFVSGKEVPQAWLDVQAERRRQITAEGWTPDHDDLYCAAELPRAAAAYILSGANDEAPAIWPFSAKWWKPRDARANYMRAGALILAEIERLDRAAAAGKEVGHE
jgi:hypothetical protein